MTVDGPFAHGSGEPSQFCRAKELPSTATSGERAGLGAPARSDVGGYRVAVAHRLRLPTIERSRQGTASDRAPEGGSVMAMVMDPVCGMEIDTSQAAAQTSYEG